MAVSAGAFALGWLAAMLVLRHRRSDPTRQPPAPAPLEREILRHSSTGYLVLNEFGLPLLSNARALELEARLLEKEWSGEPGLFARMRLR